ncbi:MAG: hypothetical protein AB8G15_05600 [Saprospiraceae bacterium]
MPKTVSNPTLFQKLLLVVLLLVVLVMFNWLFPFHIIFMITLLIGCLLFAALAVIILKG